MEWGRGDGGHPRRRGWTARRRPADAAPLALALAGIALAVAALARARPARTRSSRTARSWRARSARGTASPCRPQQGHAVPPHRAGVALCFRARVINIGGEGQIALGGLGRDVGGADPARRAGHRVPRARPRGRVRRGRGVGRDRRPHPAHAPRARSARHAPDELHRRAAGERSPPRRPRRARRRLSPVAAARASRLAPEARPRHRSPRRHRPGDRHGLACHLALWRTPFGFRLRVRGASEKRGGVRGHRRPPVVLR